MCVALAKAAQSPVSKLHFGKLSEGYSRQPVLQGRDHRSVATSGLTWSYDVTHRVASTRMPPHSRSLGPQRPVS